MLAMRKEREARGWSLADVSVKTGGIGPSILSEIERQRRYAYPGWRKRIAKAFGMSEEKLFVAVDDDA